MSSRHHSSAMPPPRTESAREARKAFHCDLCGKGYSRIHEFEAHENSYDHQHKKRFLEMKAMQRASTRPAKKSEDLGVKKIEIDIGTGGAGKKKAGFRSAFAGAGGEKKEVKVEGREVKEEKEEGGQGGNGVEEEELMETDSEDEAKKEGWTRYNPDRPTD